MSENVFKVGDTVRLKSGGPVMTVKEVDDQADEVHCQWFVDEESKFDCYPTDSLEPWEDPGRSLRQ